PFSPDPATPRTDPPSLHDALPISRLAQHPVHKAIRAAGLLGQRPDARTGVVLLLQVCRELVARGAGNPAALLQSLGHPCLLMGSALWSSHDHPYRARWPPIRQGP